MCTGEILPNGAHLCQFHIQMFYIGSLDISRWGCIRTMEISKHYKSESVAKQLLAHHSWDPDNSVLGTFFILQMKWGFEETNSYTQPQSSWKGEEAWQWELIQPQATPSQGRHRTVDMVTRSDFVASHPCADKETRRRGVWLFVQDYVINKEKGDEFKPKTPGPRAHPLSTTLTSS